MDIARLNEFYTVMTTEKLYRKVIGRLNREHKCRSKIVRGRDFLVALRGKGTKLEREVRMAMLGLCSSPCFGIKRAINVTLPSVRYHAPIVDKMANILGRGDEIDGRLHYEVLRWYGAGYGYQRLVFPGYGMGLITRNPDTLHYLGTNGVYPIPLDEDWLRSGYYSVYEALVDMPELYAVIADVRHKDSPRIALAVMRHHGIDVGGGLLYFDGMYFRVLNDDSWEVIW